jgi:epoxyqueuosine reductase
MADILQAWAAQRGCRVAWGSTAAIENARREIAARKAASEIEAAFYEGQLDPIIAGQAEPSGRTVIVVAMPRPAHLIHFELDGSSFEGLFPPTYFRYRALFEEVRLDLAENALRGSRIEFLPAPLKAIASRLGLVKYGRNNISYAKGLGSYFQLCGYVTDAKLPETDTAECAESLLSECDNCGICTSVCPTGAVVEERVLLRAERCLTFLNENPGDWPEWLSGRAHNALLGCLECQRACPANPELSIEDTGVCFSAAETRRLLSGKAVADDRTNTGIRSKLAWLGQPYSEPVLGRNLRALARAGGVVL